MIFDEKEIREALARGASAIISPAPGQRPLLLFLGPAAIASLGAELDRMFPGVHLYEAALIMGEAPKFVRVLGETCPP